MRIINMMRNSVLLRYYSVNNSDLFTLLGIFSHHLEKDEQNSLFIYLYFHMTNRRKKDICFTFSLGKRSWQFEDIKLIENRILNVWC